MASPADAAGGSTNSQVEMTKAKAFFQPFARAALARPAAVPGPEAGCGQLPASVRADGGSEMPFGSVLLQSALGEPAEAVYFPELPQGSDSSEPALHIRNLDTGSVFLLEPEIAASPTASPHAEKHVGPEKLGRAPAAAWSTWWSQKRVKDDELLAAAASGDAAAVQRALEPPTDGSAPASVDARGAGGRTPLHVACATPAGAGSVAVLLAAGATVDACTDAGLSALHVASQCGDVQAVRLLLEAGAGVLQKTGDGGNLALHLAAVNGHLEVIAALLRYGGRSQLLERNDVGQRPVDASRDVRTVQAFEAERCGAGDSFASRKAFAPEGVLLRNSRVDFVQRILAKSSAASPSVSESEHTGSGISSGASEAASTREPPTPRRNRTRTPRVVAEGSRGGTTRRNMTRGPFARVRTDSTAEQVGPSSFEAVNMLGRGSFGEVYLVKRKRTGEAFAMKVLQKSKVFSKNLQRYAMSERNILSYARHPYIVSLHWAFQTSSCLVMVLEFCPNGNLQQLISQQRRLPEDVSQLYTSEILLALVYLHERKVIFRDLKPDNVVMDEQRHAKLTDFGLSKEAVGDHGSKTFCGSVAFLAPEIIARREHNHAVDIYNLGVLLFNMLTGMPPYYDNDRERLFKNIRKAPLEVPAYVSAPAKAFIEATMKRAPDQRLGARRTAEAQEHFYFEGLDFEAVLAREVPVPELPTAAFAGRGQGTRLPRGAPEPFDRRESAGQASPVVADWEFSAFQPAGAATADGPALAEQPVVRRRRTWTFGRRSSREE